MIGELEAACDLGEHALLSIDYGLVLLFLHRFPYRGSQGGHL